MARVIQFTSAARQVGKTSLCVNLALSLGQLGHTVCLFNADADAAAITNLLGTHPRFCLKDLIENRARMEHAILRDAHGIDYFSAYPGLSEIRAMDQNTRNRLNRAFMYFNRYDFFLVDTFPGISRNVVALCKASPEVVLVMTADAHSLTNAYLFLKSLSVNHFAGSVMVLFNMSGELKLARGAYNRFKDAVSRYLPITVTALGTVFFDQQVREAEKERCPFISRFPDSDASRCIANIAKHLSDKKSDDMAVSGFWSRFVEQLKRPYRIVGGTEQIFKPKSIRPTDKKDDAPEAGVTEPAPPGPPSSTEPGDEKPSGMDAIDALARLEAQMADLSEAVTDIKQTLDTISENRRTDSASNAKKEPAPIQEKERLVLDFDTFLAQRGKDGN